MFNTLRYARKLEGVGFTRDQAEAHVQIIAEIIEGDVATKQDLRELELMLKQDLSEFRQEVKHGMQSTEHRLVIKLSAIMASMFTIVIAVFALIVKLH